MRKQSWTTASLSCLGTLQLSEKQSWTTASLSCSGTLQLSEKTKLDNSLSIMLRYITIKGETNLDYTSLSCSGTLQLSEKQSWTTASLSCLGTLQLSEKQSWTTASLSFSGTLQLSEKTKLNYNFSIMLRYVTIKWENKVGQQLLYHA